MQTGIVLLGHGSQAADANLSLHQISRNLFGRAQGKLIEPAFLQFAQPTLSQSIAKLLANGAQKIVVVPFFLFKGHHVTVDIPNAVGQESLKYPNVEIVTASSIGDDPRMLDIITSKIEAALA